VAEATVVIPRRFNGPPESGNGGYSCGVVAGMLDGEAVQVSLRAPPPLERPLAVERGDPLTVLDGDTVVAEAELVDLDLDVPEPLSVEEAGEAARAGYARWTRGHPFPTCFVCGPEREPGDGLRIFPGPVPDRDLWAASWMPDASLAEAGAVLPECVWAALDCPTSAPVANFGEGAPVVLARLTARLDAPVDAGRAHVLLSWKLGANGRKRHAAAALFSENGELLACSRALWIELPS
jgi:hypothetical protein